MPHSEVVDFTVRRSFPHPVAAAWHRVSLAASDTDRINAAFDVQDILLRTLVCLLLPDYLRGAPVEKVEAALRPLSRPAMGHWVGMLREILDALRQRSEPAPFMPEAIDWYYDARGKTTFEARRIDLFTTERNREAHGTRTQGSLANRSRADEITQAAHDILQDLSWLAGYRPFRVVGQEPVRTGGMQGKLQFFVGSERQPRPTTAKWDATLLPGAIYLANPGGEALLEISPLVQVMLDPGSNQDRLFLLKQLDRSGRVVLINDATSAELTVPLETTDGAPPFQAWLAQREVWQPWQRNRDTSGGLCAPEWSLAGDATHSLDERFEFIELLGEGGMAQVHRARDTWVGEEVALKVLRSALSEEPSFHTRFMREAQTMRDLDHPGLLPLIDLGKLEDGRLFIKMPIVPGGTLKDLIRPRGLPPSKVLDLARQALAALAYLQERGVIHRDVKPSNFFLDDEGRLLLGDFGISVRQEDARLTQTMQQFGSMAYASPEQRLGNELDDRTDVYSLALTLHALATGTETAGRPGKGVAGEMGTLIRAMGAEKPQERLSAAAALALLDGTTPPHSSEEVADGDSGDNPLEQTFKAEARPQATPAVKNRRGWMIAVATIGALLLAVGIGRILHVDDDTSPEPPTPAPESTPATGDPVRGDTLVVGVRRDANTLLPAVSRSNLDLEIADFMYPCLVRYGFGWEVDAKPSLAERWEFGEDGRRITFHLRQDVRWTDGSPVDADDVVFTLDLIRDPTTKSVIQQYLQHLQPDEGIEKLDAHTVTLRYVKAYDPATMLAHVSALPIAPEHLLRAWPRDQLLEFPYTDSPVSSGLFELDRWDRGDELALVRTDGAPHPAYLDGVTFKVIESYDERLAALESGQIDMMDNIRVADFARQQREHTQLRHAERGLRSVDLVGWNLRDERFADARVRTALARAIDADAIIEDVLTAGKKTYGARAVGTITPDLRGSHNFAIQPLAHDPAGARALLAEVGWADRDGDGWLDRDGTQFVFRLRTHADDPRRARVLDLVAAQLAEVGIRATPAILPEKEFFQAISAGDFDAVLLGLNADLFVDPTRYWYTDAAGPHNFYPYSNDKVDELIQKGVDATDPAEAARCWREMQALIYEDQPCCFLYWRQRILAIHSRFQDVATDTLGLFTDLEDWWVPADRQKYTGE